MPEREHVLLVFISYHSYIMDFIKNLLSGTVTTIHYLVLAFVLITPFTNNIQLLILYSVFIPFLYLHWLTNNNVCALTTLERMIKGNNKQCFTCDIINPIFNFHMDYDEYSRYTYLITGFLWIIVILKLLIVYKVI